jgi:hypothetical protein
VTSIGIEKVIQIAAISSSHPQYDYNESIFALTNYGRIFCGHWDAGKIVWAVEITPDIHIFNKSPEGKGE